MNKPVFFTVLLITTIVCTLSGRFEEIVASGICAIGGDPLRMCNSSDHTMKFCAKLDPQSGAQCGSWYESSTAGVWWDEFYEVKTVCTHNGCVNEANKKEWQDLNCTAQDKIDP